MKTSKLLLMGTLILTLFMIAPAMAATSVVQPFTGNVENDFPEVPGNGILVIVDPGGQDIGVQGTTRDSGWDLKDLRLAYDNVSDTLYVGINNYGVVGDPEGNGNPSLWDTTVPGDGEDYPNLGSTECVAVFFDLDMAPSLFDDLLSWDVIIGVGSGFDFFNFGIYNTDGKDPPSNFRYEPLDPDFGRIPGHLGVLGDPDYPINPDAAHPDLEFAIRNFSTLAGDLDPAVIDAVISEFRVGLYEGSADDTSGEEHVFYQEIPSTTVTIDPTRDAVIEGGTVSLEVTEHNDSFAERAKRRPAASEEPPEAPIIVPYVFSAVQVAVTQNGSPISASPLGAPPNSGDNGNDLLDPDETWVWTGITSDAITATTTFIASGSGTGPIGFIHTFVEDPDEQAQAQVAFLSTDVGISASATAVGVDGTVDLTVTETNDGDEDLTNVSVAVTYDNGGGPTPLVILTAPPTSGDAVDPGVLNAGETWTWDSSTVIALDDFPITASTTFTATGSAQYDDGVNPVVTVTYPGDTDEQDSVTVVPLSTDVGISALPTTVPIGGTVDLTVTENNDGDVPLTNVSVAVTFDNGGGPTPLVILTAPPTSGDGGVAGVLEAGETWTWDASTVIALNDIPITAVTTFTATGSAQYDDGVNPVVTVTYPGDLDEQESITVGENPDTVIDITANGSDGPITVCVGETVTLTICEQNTGEIDLTDPFVELYDDPTLVSAPIATLDETSPEFTGTDGADLGELDQGEEWCWDVDVVVTDPTTTFTAIAYGYINGTILVTWCIDTGNPPADTICDQDERNDVIVNTEECGGEGCTPGFWKNNADNWGHSAWVGYLPTDSFETIFDVDVTLRGKGKDTYPNPTLLDALNANGGGINALARHAVAALLNTSSPCVNYAYTDVGALITDVHNAILAGDAAIQELHSDLAYDNEAGCPISQHQQGGQGCTD
jgi:hypothetical protein